MFDAKMKPKKTNIKKITYSTTPLFILVAVCFAVTIIISVFFIDVENFYATDSKQMAKKKDLQFFCILKPTTSNIYGDKTCDENTYVEFDIFQYVDENEYHIIQYAEGITGQGNRCGLRKDYQFGDWSMLDKSGKPYSNTSGNYTYTLTKCIKYVLEDFCSSEFRSYDIYSFSKKGWEYDCRPSHRIIRKAEKYIK